jgi:cytoskeletal protein CcmA (bactofilin family)
MSHPYDMGDKKQHSVLGPTLKFKGELTAEEDLLIQGTVEGSIKHTSNLTIGKEGTVKADVKAEHISVEGKVDGDLVGRTSVVVKESANVTGNIFSPTVTLREGSKFNGKIDMSGSTKSGQNSTRDNAARSGSEQASSQSGNDNDAESHKADDAKKRSVSAA